MKVDIPIDCGNSPRKQFIKDFNLAFAKSDIKFILNHLHDDFEWEMIGKSKLTVKESIQDFLEEMASEKMISLSIASIITHGREASCNGEITPERGKAVAFCDVYHFKDTKNNILKSIQSYRIEL